MYFILFHFLPTSCRIHKGPAIRQLMHFPLECSSSVPVTECSGLTTCAEKSAY